MFGGLTSSLLYESPFIREYHYNGCGFGISYQEMNVLRDSRFRDRQLRSGDYLFVSCNKGENCLIAGVA
jgi:hypothetical protein